MPMRFSVRQRAALVYPDHPGINSSNMVELYLVILIIVVEIVVFLCFSSKSYIMLKEHTPQP